MKVYMWIDTSNDYLLPLAVADSAAELARMIGTTPVSICSYVCHSKERNFKRSKYITVEIDDD